MTAAPHAPQQPQEEGPTPLGSVAYQMDFPAWRAYARHVAWSRRRTWWIVFGPLAAFWIVIGFVAVAVFQAPAPFVPAGLVVSAVWVWQQLSQIKSGARAFFRADAGQTRMLHLFPQGVLLETANGRRGWFWSDLARVEVVKDMLLFAPTGYPADAEALPVPRAAFARDPAAFERFAALAQDLWAKGRELPPPVVPAPAAAPAAAPAPAPSAPPAPSQDDHSYA